MVRTGGPTVTSRAMVAVSGQGDTTSAQRTGSRRRLACQASPSDQSEMPSRARSLMRNCPGFPERAGKPPALGSQTPGVEAKCYRRAATPRDAEHLGLQQDFDAFVRQQFPKRVRYVRIFPLAESRTVLDDRHAAAEAPHRLGEFQADVAAAEDDEVAGQPFQVQGLDMRHRRGGGQPGHVRNAGAGADVDKNTLAPQ